MQVIAFRKPAPKKAKLPVEVRDAIATSAHLGKKLYKVRRCNGVTNQEIFESLAESIGDEGERKFKAGFKEGYEAGKRAARFPITLVPPRRAA